MIHLATGITRNYLPRARAYLDSLARFEPNRAHVFCVDFTPTPEDAITVRHSHVDFSRCLQHQKSMLQSGAFTQFVPEFWRENGIVAFTDADAVLQRGISLAEQECMTPASGVVQVGRNHPSGKQTLE